MPRSRSDLEFSVLVMMYGSTGLFFGLAMGLRVADRFVDDWRLDLLMIGSTLAALFTYFMGRFLSIRFKRAWGLYADRAPAAAT